MRGMLCLAAAVLAASVAFGAGPFAGKLVFTSTRDGNAEIYVINADGTNLLRLTNNKATDDEPVLSPDGSKVLTGSGDATAKLCASRRQPQD